MFAINSGINSSNSAAKTSSPEVEAAKRIKIFPGKMMRDFPDLLPLTSHAAAAAGLSEELGLRQYWDAHVDLKWRQTLENGMEEVDSFENDSDSSGESEENQENIGSGASESAATGTPKGK